jgi:hypothetical protein
MIFCSIIAGFAIQMLTRLTQADPELNWHEVSRASQWMAYFV